MVDSASIITLTVDGAQVKTSGSDTVLDALHEAGVYMPRLCSHPDLPGLHTVKSRAFVYRKGQKIEGNPDARIDTLCSLTAVRVRGRDQPVNACSVAVEDGMVVETKGGGLETVRRRGLAEMHKFHPHVCLTCPYKDGCSRDVCTLNVPVEGRCCSKFDTCEVRKVSDYMGLENDIPNYANRGLPVDKEQHFMDIDYNLCIGCMRCVTACSDLRNVGALGFTVKDGQPTMGLVGPTLEESGCRFCGACIEVCPTGALLTKKDVWNPTSGTPPPCEDTCPAGINVPQYVRLISEGRFEDAHATVMESTPLARSLGRVCPRPCEDDCVRGKVDQPIAICQLKRFAADHSSFKASTKRPGVGRRVAVVGSGPAGLSAAYFLALAGYSVKVFEAKEKAGGMLRYGIPPYRLPAEEVEEDIQEIIDLGVEFETGVSVGRDIDLEELKKAGFDAILVAVGKQLGRPLEIDGVGLHGVVDGVAFLRQRVEGTLDKELVRDKRVIVIGGGDAAIDAARSSLRLGAKSAQMFYRRGKVEMPAQKAEVDDSIQEGVSYEFNWSPSRILGEDGRVKGVEFVRSFSENRLSKVQIEESVKTVADAEVVVLAVGQVPDMSGLPTNASAQGSPRMVADGIFFAGDIAEDEGTVVDAIGSGKKAASLIDEHFGHPGNIHSRVSLVAVAGQSMALPKVEAFYCQRATMPTIPVGERILGFTEVEQGFAQADAVREASRCLRCDLRLKFSKVPLPPDGYLEFKVENASRVPDKSGVYKLYDNDKKVIFISGVPSLSKSVAEQLQSSNPKAKDARYFTFGEAMMYTQRESELIQEHLHQHGKLPPMNDETDDLF